LPGEGGAINNLRVWRDSNDNNSHSAQLIRDNLLIQVNVTGAKTGGVKMCQAIPMISYICENRNWGCRLTTTGNGCGSRPKQTAGGSRNIFKTPDSQVLNLHWGNGQPRRDLRVGID
jgi:hypothetical protein